MRSWVAVTMTSLTALAVACSATSDPAPPSAGSGGTGAAAMSMGGQAGTETAGHVGVAGGGGTGGNAGVTAGGPGEMDASAEGGSGNGVGENGDAERPRVDAESMRDAAARGDEKRDDSGARADGGTGELATRAAVISAMRKANDYFTGKWPDPGADVTVGGKTRPSHLWTRAVYYEGLMALYAVDVEQRSKYQTYAESWAESHSWGLNTGVATRSADNQCAGQTYVDLYSIKNEAVRVRDIKASVDAMLASSIINDWTWIDALQMAMPVFARLGVLYGKSTYFDRMYAMYHHTKTVEGGKGLYNPADHLWWRDKDFVAPYVEPNGSDCYWSRGNGWVLAALARVVDILPTTDAHRDEYVADFVAMAGALKAVQRSDGFWNVSLHDPTHFEGKELSGTALFTYGMAWGVRKGILPAADYAPVVAKAWTAMITDSLHSNGSLGWVQSTGKQPSDGQPLSSDKLPDFEDYGLGCFLLAGSEVAQTR